MDMLIRAPPLIWTCLAAWRDACLLISNLAFIGLFGISCFEFRISARGSPSLSYWTIVQYTGVPLFARRVIVQANEHRVGEKVRDCLPISNKIRSVIKCSLSATVPLMVAARAPVRGACAS